MDNDGDHGKHPKGTKHVVDAEYERKFAELIDNYSDWSRLTRDLIVYTARKHGERASRYGHSPEDYAQTAVMLALELRRVYDFDGGKTFEQFLMSVIDSLVSHVLERPAHNKSLPLMEYGDADDDRRPAGIDLSKLVAPGRPDDVIDRIDAERLAATLPAELRELHRINQSTKLTAKEKAGHLGITVSEVNNRERRLKRHLKR